MRRLYLKLAAALAMVLVVLAAGLLALTARTSHMYEQEVQQRLNAELAPHMVDKYALLREHEVNQEALKELFDQLMVINPAIEVYLLDASGEILAFSAPEGHVVRRRVSLAPVQELLDGNATGLILGDDPRDVGRSKAFNSAPILSDGRLEGYVYVVLGGEAYDGVAGMLGRSYILRLSAWIGGGILLVALAVAAVLFQRLTRPLAELDAEMARFGATTLGTDPEPLAREGDEIARLEASFRHMAQRIGEQMEQLERTDQLRRELVANASHDLRTPLTQLSGYLETLQLRHESLSPDERAEYLETAIRHSEQLGRLVDELFELARLDALDAPLRSETFSINELAHDIVRRYRLAAQDRQIQLVLTADGRCEMRGDPALIARSLENLIDNALRHTPDGGRVEVLAAPGSGMISVQVRDTGEGIAEADQERIFDPFYRGASTSARGIGGLGLAIAKRAIELHRGRIRVDSRPGGGSAFELELPVAADFRFQASGAVTES